ncbi:hypothetical protein JCM3774_006679 [Rhodotorula dairenensis]
MTSGRLPAYRVPFKAVPGLSAYCLLNSKQVGPVESWGLSSTRKQGAVFVVAAGMSFEVGLADTRQKADIGWEDYEAILFLDGRQKGELFYPFTFEPTKTVAPEEDHDGTGIGDLAAHRATGSAQIRIYRLSEIEDIESQPGYRQLETRQFLKHKGGVDSEGNPVAAQGIKCLSSVVAALSSFTPQANRLSSDLTTSSLQALTNQSGKVQGLGGLDMPAPSGSRTSTTSRTELASSHHGHDTDVLSGTEVSGRGLDSLESSDKDGSSDDEDEIEFMDICHS